MASSLRCLKISRALFVDIAAKVNGVEKFFYKADDHRNQNDSKRES